MDYSILFLVTGSVKAISTSHVDSLTMLYICNIQTLYSFGIDHIVQLSFVCTF